MLQWNALVTEIAPRCSVPQLEKGRRVPRIERKSRGQRCLAQTRSQCKYRLAGTSPDRPRPRKQTNAVANKAPSAHWRERSQLLPLGRLLSRLRKLPALLTTRCTAHSVHYTNNPIIYIYKISSLAR